jgi:hypothetical protein
LTILETIKDTVDPERRKSRRKATEAERVKARKWSRRMETSRKAKAKRQDEIDTCWEFWRGKHYPGGYKDTEAAAGRYVRQRNYVRSIVEDAVALICDNRPGIKALPTEPNDIQRAEYMTVLQDYCWTKEQMPVEHPICVRAMLVGGIGAARVLFDPDKDYPYGNPDVVPLDWKRVLPDPNGRDWFGLSDFEFIAEEAWIPMSRFRRENPGIDVAPEDKAQRDRGEISIPTETDQAVDGVDDGPGETTDGVWVYRIWHEADEDDDGEGLFYTEVAGDRVIKDEKWDGAYPFLFWVGDIDVEEDHPYPFGMVEMLIDAQKDMNLGISRIYEALKHRPLTTFAYTTESGIKENMISNLEAVKLKLTGPLDSFKWYSPEAIPADVFKWLSETREDFHILSGIRPAMQGRMEEASSGVAIGRLQAMGLARVRKMIVNTDAAITRLAELNDEIIKKHFTVTRQIRITGQDVAPQQPQVDESGQPVKHSPFLFLDVNSDMFFEDVPGEVGMDDEGHPVDEAIRREARFDYVFEAGSTMAGTKELKRQQSMELYKGDAIRLEDLLKDFDRANWQEIVAEKDELAQLRQLVPQLQAQLAEMTPIVEDYQRAMAHLKGQGGQGEQGGLFGPGGGRR